MRILTFTSLFPNKMMPTRGVFVKNRLAHLVKDTGIEARVIAPRPWFPFLKYISQEYNLYSIVPEAENIHGMCIQHPRYFHLPKIGMLLQPLFMALGAIPSISKLIKSGYEFDVIDAHYFYPDGIAAYLLAKLFKKKVVITARGSDLNVYTKYFLPRVFITHVAKHCSAIITVSESLKKVLTEMSIDPGKITVLRNGVDTEVFQQLPELERQKLKMKYGLSGAVILMVGRLVKLKGHELAINALTMLNDATLVIVGDGEERKNLEELAKSLSILDRVRFIGAVDHSDLRTFYSLADILLLASSNEGWPNVLLEAMACGTPVVATNVGGVPEIVKVPDTGVLVKQRSVQGIVSAINELLQISVNRDSVSRYASNFGWAATSAGQQKLFSTLEENKA